MYNLNEGLYDIHGQFKLKHKEELNCLEVRLPLGVQHACGCEAGLVFGPLTYDPLPAAYEQVRLVIMWNYINLHSISIET